MKVTALIPDKLVKEVRHYSGRKNITESIILALEEWLSHKKIIELNDEIASKPLLFHKDYSAGAILNINRSR